MIDTTCLRRAGNESQAIPIRPLVRLARCMSVEDVLNNLAEIVKEKGITLCAIRLVGDEGCQEFGPGKRPANAEDVFEVEASVEGRKTRLIVLFTGSISPKTRCELEDAAHMAAQRIELLRERRPWTNRKVDQPFPTIKGMIGDSEPMIALKRRIVAAAGCGSTVLITGESGTGKELAARAIHSLSPRAAGPFVAINCGTFTEALLESELFGYLKGAFTGAASNRKGLFEAAREGTIFLDEIGEAAPAVQLRLLRVLQERKVRPIGAHDEREVDVRIIAATNRDLCREVEEKRFRQDLFYRLRVLTVSMPPLRRRREDIPALAEHFLRVIRDRLGFSFPVEIEEEAVRALCSYQWTGNVRELEATLERMAVEAGDGGVITAEQARAELSIEKSFASAQGEIQYVGVLRAGESLVEHFRRQEPALYELVRARMGGNHSKAARWLGMDRTLLYHRVGRARQRTAG
jgi:transcriptional regulator with PAS, ATPase and Fis domain